MCNISLMSWCGFILRSDYWRGKMSHIKCTKYLVSFLEVKNRAVSTKKWNQASSIIINLSSRLKIARRHKYICLYISKYSVTKFLILNLKDKCCFIYLRSLYLQALVCIHIISWIFMTLFLPSILYQYLKG